MSRSLNITAGCPWGEKYLNILSNSVKQTWTLRFRKQTIGKNLKQCLNLILFSLITLWQTEKKPTSFTTKQVSRGLQLHEEQVQGQRIQCFVFINCAHSARNISSQLSKTVLSLIIGLPKASTREMFRLQFFYRVQHSLNIQTK